MIISILNMTRNVENKSITVIPSDWVEFGRICEKNGMDRSKLIRKWVNKFIDDCKTGKININI